MPTICSRAARRSRGRPRRSASRRPKPITPLTPLHHPRVVEVTAPRRQPTPVRVCNASTKDLRRAARTGSALAAFARHTLRELPVAPPLVPTGCRRSPPAVTVRGHVHRPSSSRARMGTAVARRVVPAAVMSTVGPVDGVTPAFAGRRTHPVPGALAVTSACPDSASAVPAAAARVPTTMARRPVQAVPAR
jgi:hypothetical protein